jgi:xanthine permease XanP
MSSEGLPNIAPASFGARALSYLYPASSRDTALYNRKKPTNLLYDVDETPPFAVQLALSVQHIFLMSTAWLYVAVIVAAVGGTEAQAESMIRISMIASGLATILQSSPTLLGSGYLCPLSGSLTYLQPSILAASEGGFALLFGMVSVAGIFTGFLSRITSRLRVLFPPEVTGLMVSMSGLQLVALGCPRFVGYTPTEPIPHLRAVIVGVMTLLGMVMATVWNRGKLHVLPMLIGLSIGFSCAVALGVLPWRELVHEFSGPWIGVPHRAAGGFAFRFALLLPFLIASLTASLKSVGDVTLCQKINDADWKRTDMKSISGGLFANAAGTFASGIFGGIAQNTVSSSIGLSLATGTTSRAIALPTGLLVMALAFFPRISAIFAAMPMPVMGAMLIYSACFIILSGVQLLSSRMLDARRIFVVGISLIFGLSVEISPEVYRFAPDALRPIFSSSTSLATVLVVLLSFFMRLGMAKRRSFSFHPATENIDMIHQIMEEQGAAWGMRREVEVRAENAIQETVGRVVELNPSVRQVHITVQFDELKLEAAVEYVGAAPIIAAAAPNFEELATDEGVAMLSGFMIRQYANDVRVRSRGPSTRIELHFEH